MDHVMTQLPYACSIAFGTLMDYLAIGYTIRLGQMLL
ncbi:hypothetical protein [Photobacterium pectinilyticum]